MGTKKQFTENVEMMSNAFANWFSKPDLLSIFNAMNESQKAEFRKRMITIFATELANA